MTKLIAIDDGHGMETPGKRTPIFPDGTVSPETGKPYMHENEFNRAVAARLKVHLERSGFRTLMVAPGDSDVPLSTRVQKANSANAHFYISIHANANTSVWGSWGGIETYHYPGAADSAKAATLIQKRLMQGTKLRNRGVKSANFYVLQHTKMTAVLVECAFMDNLTEAKLLLSTQYREECAKEIAQGICDYFNIRYVP
ncbi:N-acetylmuramoyl-L-alanine amidase family protein [Paenibacillus sp. 481]|uniref:N-acetylmuramoyl-L-alanine amidase family protein n=1 Tax=Paenibacillus sp. 481 TaxID=2835869 RepID=UPI001E41F816|nr:N-acetylmuramoyl-L-alanine amidase [Paenibacillus sp. 481]UHA72309.1 N-acetylmuramoyl-L-alanine amidase [Paenibacillus sp. 481]